MLRNPRNPRKLYRITDFSGGINTETDPTNLAPNEGLVYQNVRPKEGRLVNREGVAQITSHSNNTCKGCVDFFDIDDNWRILTTYTSGSDTKAKIGYGSLTSFSWDGAEETLWSSLTTDTPSFLVESGNVRIGGSHSKETKIYYNFDNKKRFNNSGNYTLDGVVFTNAKIQHPILDYGDTTPDGEYELGFSYSISAGSGELSSGDTVQYGFTFEYDGSPTGEGTGQESLLSVSDKVITATADNDKIQLELNVLAGTAAGRPYDGINERISAINIYRSLNGGDFYFWKRVDINTGITDDSDTTRNWSEQGLDPYYMQISPIHDYGAVLTESYSARTGYELYNTYANGGDPDPVVGDEHDLEIKWKTAIIAQGHCICGNVKKMGTVYNDRLYISPAGWFDCFPEDRYVELGTGDGDAIVALAQLGTRVVVFKSNHTYLYNISSANELNWFKERTYPMGANSVNAIAQCPYGVLFANNKGAWLLALDGTLTELSRKVRDEFIAFEDGNTLYSIYDPLYDEYFICNDNYAADITANRAISGTCICHVRTGTITSRADSYLIDLLGQYKVLNYFHGPKKEICFVINDSTDSKHKFFYHTGSGTSGLTSAAQALYTGHLTLDGSLDTYKRTKYLYLTAKNDGKELYVRISKDGESPITVKTISSTSSLTRTKIAIPYTLRTIQVQVYTLYTPIDFELREIAIEYFQKRAK